MQEAQRTLSQIISFKDSFKQNAVLVELAEDPAQQTALCEIWSLKYKTIVHNLRADVQNAFPEIHAKNIDEVQLRLTEGYARLLQSMLAEAFRLMGEPPCAFAWVGAGSFSRSEVLPYSDAEYLWLFRAESLKVRRYFWAVNQLIVAQIHSIDEPLGLHPDQYMEVTTDEEMKVNLPDSMRVIINRFNTKCKTPEGLYTEILSNLQGRLIEGSETLWLQYLRQVKTYNPLHDVFHKLLLVSVGDYDKTWGERVKNQQSQLNIKEGYGYFLTYLAVILKFYHGVEGSSTQEIWTALIAAQKIDPALGKTLAIASQEIQALRCRMHFFYQESRQDIDISQSEDGKIYGLSEKEYQTLSKIQKLIRQVYRHLGAVKKIESLTKLKKTQTEESFKESLKTLADLLGEYQSIEIVLMKPRLSQGIVASYFYRLLTLPQWLGTPSGETCLLFLLNSGVSVGRPNTLGMKPMEVILSWSEDYPEVAQKTWQALLNYGGNIEELLSNGRDNLLSHAIHLQKHETFIVLCHLGAGRINAPTVLFQYIYTQFSSPKTPANQKKNLQKALPHLMQQNPALGWQLTLSTLRLEQSNSLLQVEGTYMPQGFLNPQMEKALFQQKGKVQAVNEYGRREVAKCALNPVITVWAKFYPELPGIEESVRSLSNIISAHHTVPNSELFCFKNKTEEYPVLISQEVVGENLQTILNQAYRDKNTEALEKLKAVDSAQWTALFILTVLIHPEDGKPDNYILKPFQDDQGKTVYAIVGIDNDHAFVEAFTDHPDENKAFQIKTIVYCLDQMQVPLDLTVVQDFLAKGTEKSLSDWLDSLALCQKRYEQLFSEETRERLFAKESVPQIIFPPKSLPKLYERWIRLKKALDENPKMMAMTALLHADSQVGLRYQAVFEAHEQPLERFHAIASPAYLFSPKVGQYKTLVTSGQLLKSQCISEKLLLSSQQYGPEAAKKELYQALYQYKDIDNLARQLSQGDIDSFANIALIQTQEAVLKKTDFSPLADKQQEKFIRLILDKRTGLLGLKSLVLVNLIPLTSTALLKLIQVSPALTSLRLVGLPHIKKLNFLKSLPLQNQIKTVVLQQLTQCTKINLHLPALKHLVLIALPMCKKLDLLSSHQLKQLKVHNCSKFSLKENLTGLIRQNPYLTIWQCELDKKMDTLVPVFIEKAKTNDEMWHTAVYIKTLALRSLTLNFPTISRESVLICLSALLCNPTIEHVEIHDQKSETIRALMDKTKLVEQPFAQSIKLVVVGAHSVGKSCLVMQLISGTFSDAFDPTLEDSYRKQITCDGQEVILNIYDTGGYEGFAAVRNQYMRIGEVFVICFSITWYDTFYEVMFLHRDIQAMTDKNKMPVILVGLRCDLEEDREVPYSTGEKLAARYGWIYLEASGKTRTNVLRVFEEAIRSCKAWRSRQVLDLTTIGSKLKNTDGLIQASEELGTSKPTYLDQTFNEEVSFLIGELESKSEYARRSAVAEVLGNLKQATPEVIRALLKALKDEDDSVRSSAAKTLGKLNQATAEVISALLKALEDKNLVVRNFAAEALVKLGHETPGLIAAFLKALEDKDAYVRGSAAKVLGKLKQATPEVITALLKALGDENDGVRISAAKASGKLNQGTAEVIAALLKALGDENDGVRRSAAEALGELCRNCHSLNQTNLQAVRSLSGKFDLLMQETECRLIFHAPENLQILQTLLTDMLISVDIEGSQIKIPKGIAIAGLTELLWSLQPAKIVCVNVLEEAHATALSRFQPRIETLILKNKNIFSLQLALIHTRGVLEIVGLESIEYGEQHISLVPLRGLKGRLEINRKNAKTLHITLQNISSVKVTQKLLEGLCSFIKMMNNTVESHLSEKMLQIYAEQEIVIADILDLLKALQTWAALQPDKRKKLKAPCKPKDKTKLLTPQETHREKISPAERNSISSESAVEPGTPLISSSLTRLITPVNYSEIFKRYREPIWAYIEGKATDSLQTLVENVVHSTVQPIEKIILLEAVEWQKVKLNQYTEQMQELTLTQSFQAQEKKPQWKVIPALLKDYQAYLKNHLHAAGAQQAYDSCLVLFTALQAKHIQGKKWEEKTFFRQLTEQQVYHACHMPLSQGNLQTFWSSSMKDLWKKLLQDSQQRLPVRKLETQKQNFDTQREAAQKRYQDFIVCLQQYLALPTQQWKHRYFNQISANPLQRCGGKNGNFIYGFFHLSRAWDNKRWMCFDNAQFSSLLGSTYFSNDKPLDAEETLCLDANYQQDHTGATADGYGHFGSLGENRKVQLAAYRTVKYMTRYAALYPDPESLMAELPALFHHVGNAVKFSFLHPKEAGTASCVLTRVFHTGKRIMLVCAGIGDGMVAVFDPVKKIAKTLIAPRQYDRGGQFIPLSITEKFAEESLQTVCCELSDKAIILRMTDGAWETLPHRKIKYHDPQIQRDYLAYTLDEDFLFKFCLTLDIEEATAQEYRRLFETYIQKNIESRRNKLIEQQELIQKYLSAFEEINTDPHVSMGDFITWAENQWPEFKDLLEDFLKSLNIDTTDVQKLPLVNLYYQLEHIWLGDDITLHVECISGEAQVVEKETSVAKLS